MVGVLGLTAVVMSEVSMAEFKGIVEFHDGLAVSDYLNMIPLGTTCVDRYGDRLVINSISDDGFKVRGVFIDSLHNIYVAYGPALYRYKYDESSDEIISGPELMTMVIDGEVKPFAFRSYEGEITFCESAIKPSVVFVCDGELIYAWATTQEYSRPQYAQFRVNVIAPPNLTRVDETDNGNLVYWQSSEVQPDFNSLIFGERRSTPEGSLLEQYISKVQVNSIDWFDNRLVCTQVSKNTVWLTRTDPMYYWRDVNAAVPYLDDESADTGGYVLWPNWYSSTSNTDRLLTVKAYNGQLYFFNEHSIEIWGRTGNEDSPIQSNTQQVLHFGGNHPTIIEGVLYFLGIDTMKDRFIGAFAPQFQKVSNREVEKRLDDIVHFYPISLYHKTYLFCKKSDGDGYIFGDAMWWRWETPKGASYHIICSVVKDFAIANTSAMIKFDTESRLSGGARIQRSIRDGFVQLQRRQIIRKVELVADTGRTSDKLEYPKEERSIYCALSTNRGLSFSQRRYRTLGETGHNDKVIEWRNLGSGNSVLIEIGTSSLHKLQIYDIKPNLG